MYDNRKQLTTAQKLNLAKDFGIHPAMLFAFLAVESAGHGFDKETGKILIQFEPNWFNHYSGTWINNGVRPQPEEWLAFNKAFKINQEAALLSTSIGIMQIMGFNYKLCSFTDVGSMWDSFKQSEYNQVVAGLLFCRAKPPLWAAIKAHDFKSIAYYYNGKKADANPVPKLKYSVKLETQFNSYKKLLV